MTMRSKTEQDKIIDEVCTAVTLLNKDKVLSCVEQALELKISPHAIIRDGLCRGMQIAGMKCESGELFFPQLIDLSEIIDTAMTILKPACSHDPHLPETTIVVGVIQGDMHDIGKNILKATLTSYGYRIIDLGNDVPPNLFVDRAIKEGADMICLSTSLDTTLSGMEDVVTHLENSGFKNQIKVVVGGKPINEKFANEIGADGFAPNAAIALNQIRSLLS